MGFWNWLYIIVSQSASPKTVRRRVILPVVLLILCMGPSLLFAQDAGTEAGAVPDAAGVEAGTVNPEAAIVFGDEAPGISPAAPGVSVFLILRMLLVLVFAAAAIYGVVYFLKRASRPAEPRDPNLRILSSVHLGANRFIHAVAVGSRVLLLGAGDGGVTLITEIDDQDAVNAMLLEDSRKSAEAASGRFPDFKALLRRFGVQAGGRPPGVDTIRKRRERLKGLQ
jgi:flagellar protein FliO/FliZ